MINFQGLLVNEKGVPYGTGTPKTFIMRFSISSEDNSFIPWTGNPIEVEVIDGLFSVRLGKFDENLAALDSSVFTGNDGDGRRRFLNMEVCNSDNLRDCTPYNPRNYRGFFQKDSNQNFSPNVVGSQIPVPGVPFVVVLQQGSEVNPRLRINTQKKLTKAASANQMRASWERAGVLSRLAR